MSAKMTLVVGGARSGKSTFAQKLVSGLGMEVTYLATAEASDPEMSERIRSHRAARPAQWKTVEIWGPAGPRELPAEMEAALLDCFTVLLANLMAAHGLDWPVEEEDLLPEEEVLLRMHRIEEEALDRVDAIRLRCRELVIVSNEVGMGLVPPYRLGRIFRDLAGRLNQALADKSDEVLTIIAGLPLYLKQGEGIEG